MLYVTLPGCPLSCCPGPVRPRLWLLRPAQILQRLPTDRPRPYILSYVLRKPQSYWLTQRQLGIPILNAQASNQQLGSTLELARFLDSPVRDEPLLECKIGEESGVRSTCWAAQHPGDEGAIRISWLVVGWRTMGSEEPRETCLNVADTTYELGVQARRLGSA